MLTEMSVTIQRILHNKHSIVYRATSNILVCGKPLEGTITLSFQPLTEKKEYSLGDGEFFASLLGDKSILSQFLWENGAHQSLNNLNFDNVHKIKITHPEELKFLGNDFDDLLKTPVHAPRSSHSIRFNNGLVPISQPQR